MWQDWVLIGCIGTVDVAFLFTLLGRHKPAKTTSVVYATVLSVMTVTFLTLDLWLAAIGQSIGAAMWTATIFQRRL